MSTDLIDLTRSALGLRWGKTRFTQVKGTRVRFEHRGKAGYGWVTGVFWIITYKICLCIDLGAHPGRLLFLGSRPSVPLGRTGLPRPQVCTRYLAV
jgi:hypothetical protein